MPGAKIDEQPRYYRFTLGVLLVAFVAILAYWIVWFFVDRDALASMHDRGYYMFENAFPAADGWLALGCAASAWTLYKRRPSALFWLLVGGSAGIYLGLMDVLFDLENGVYGAPTGDWGAVATELTVNIYALGVGTWALVFGWRNRAWLTSRDAVSPSR